MQELAIYNTSHNVSGEIGSDDSGELEEQHSFHPLQLIEMSLDLASLP